MCNKACGINAESLLTNEPAMVFWHWKQRNKKRSCSCRLIERCETKLAVSMPHLFPGMKHEPAMVFAIVVETDVYEEDPAVDSSNDMHQDLQ
jgi:hypothetical protein